jgi:hypothetical protein
MCLTLLLLTGGCGGCKSSSAQRPDAVGGDARSDAGPTLTIQPTAYIVPIGRSQIFVAAGATSFSVTEAGGGTIDATGSYTAPLVPGTYHVVASDGVATGTATVTVADFELSLLTGDLGGFGHVDAAGSASRLHEPAGIVNDGAGTVYFADSGSCTIRKLVIATGAVTTLAGAANDCRDVDGTSSLARLDEPSALALDPTAGILYFAEPDGCVVRSIVIATGVVTTIAGVAGTPGSTNGVGSAALFDVPFGLTLDGLGNLYVTDNGNCVIRYIVLATDTVATLAGTVGACTAKDGASPTFHDVHGIAYDGGSLYVSDGAAIRHLGHNTAATIAGSVLTDGYSDLTGTNALFEEIGAVSSDGAGTLYIADPDNIAVRQLVISTTQVSTVAGGTINGIGDLRLGEPAGATDINGTLYVTDSNSTIHAVTLSAETVTLVAGRPPHPGAVDTTFPAATFDEPGELVADGQGKVYVIDQINHDVRTLDLTAGASALLAGDMNTGSQDGTGAQAAFYDPTGPALDGSGLLYLEDSYYCSIRQLTLPAGVVTTPFSGTTAGSNNGTGTASSFNGPAGGVVVNGVLYVADTYNYEIRAIDLATATTTTFAGTGLVGSNDGVGSAAQFAAPRSITADAANLYVFDNGLIRQIAIATATVTTIAGQSGTSSATDGIGSAATFDGPGAEIAWDGAQSLYIADGLAEVIRRMYLPTAAVNTFAGVPFDDGVLLGSITQAQLGSPDGIAIASPGTFVLSSFTENSILELVQQ